MNNWYLFLEKLLKDFRITSYTMEKQYGINGFSVIMSNLKKKQETRGISQGTIANIEKALHIKIDDSNPDNITYQKLPELPDNLPFDDAIPVYKYPVLATVYAGDPALLHYENVDEYQYFAYKKNSNRCFALRVNGQSMETTLHDGDIVLVDMDAEITEGSLVVVKLNKGQQFIKRYYIENNDFIRLSSDNREYGVKLINRKEVVTIYKVVQVSFCP